MVTDENRSKVLNVLENMSQNLRSYVLGEIERNNKLIDAVSVLRHNLSGFQINTNLILDNVEKFTDDDLLHHAMRQRSSIEEYLDLKLYWCYSIPNDV